VNGTNLRAKCEAFSASVTTTAAYTKYIEIQRTKQFIEFLGTTTQAPQTYTQDAFVAYAAVAKLPTGESTTAIWGSKVQIWHI
jgi:hypothetical protein